MQSPVPAFTRSLNALDAILAKAEAHCEARKVDPAVLVDDRIAADMLPLRRQVTIACDHAKGAAARLSGQEPPAMEDTETTFPELRDRIRRTLDYVSGVPESAFEGAEGRTILLKVAGREMSFPASEYLWSFAVPNLYFHMTTAYNILRHNGVELGKRDFIGAPSQG